MLKENIKRYNASTLFLIRPIMRKSLSDLDEYNLINSYLKDKNREDLDEDLLFVLFKPKDFDFFSFFTAKEELNENFIEDYDYEGGYTVLVYKIPISLKRDFEKFKEGKYSEFSNYTKNLYKKAVQVGVLSEKSSFQWQVFKKDPELHKELEEYVGEKLDEGIELFPVPNLERETLDIQKINENGKSVAESSQKA